ncbi:MAG: flagellar basal body rod protein FlgB [Rhizomicrobium sp.]|jgi:flagellar basal-body rod protein FlgB
MNLPSLPLLDILRARMSWLNARQGVLSQNVANADTPGYVVKDIKPLDFAKVLQNATSPPAVSPGLATTDPRHIALPGTASSGADGFSTDDLEDGSTGGVTVSAEEEMIKVADTQAQYQAAANLYSKAVGMMRTAIGSP